MGLGNSGLIEIDLDGLRSDRDKLDKQIQQLQGLNNKLSNLITRMGDSWSGNASTSYVNLMQSYAKQAEEMVGILQEFRKYADSAANKFETTDRDGASSIYRAF